MAAYSLVKMASKSGSYSPGHLNLRNVGLQFASNEHLKQHGPANRQWPALPESQSLQAWNLIFQTQAAAAEDYCAASVSTQAFLANPHNAVKGEIGLLLGHR
jgi:hypothetical protein